MISELYDEYQFGAIYTADTTDGKVTNRALGSAETEISRRLSSCHIRELTDHAPEVFTEQWLGAAIYLI